MNKKVIWITDMDFSGSGYFYISSALCAGLAEIGYEIKVIGLGYDKREYWENYSIIPVLNIQEAIDISASLLSPIGPKNISVFDADVVVAALDIPIQLNIFEMLSPILKKTGKKYIAITPLENGPLTMSWAAPMFNMDWVFFISELGKREAIKSGLSNVDHIQIGVDSEFWHPATMEEKSTLRKGLGIADDEFVVLTVADNQERKNLWAGFKAISELKKQTNKKLRHVLVTRKNSYFGWKLDDLSLSLDINKEVMIYNRGIPLKDLWGLYAVSDVYLSCSKAEGLGMPVLQAMACDIPVFATNTGALRELLEDGRGHLIPPEYTLIDVWGNEKRDMINVSELTNNIIGIMDTRSEHIENAMIFARSRTWNIPTKQLDEKIKELCDAQK